MSSSAPNPIEAARDAADGWSSAVAWMLVLALGGAAVFFGGRCDRRPDSGEAAIFPEMTLALAPVPMPAVEASPPEPAAEPPPERVPEPEPRVEPEPEPLPEPMPEPEPIAEPEPEPTPEPEAVPVPDIESAPAIAAQPEPEDEGESGEEEAIRAEWLAQLRRRIEQSKYYPGAARYSRETGTVLVRVDISSAGEIGAVRILENTGSALLAEGARGIFRRAAEKPLGTNALPEGFAVDVPITYRIERR